MSEKPENTPAEMSPGERIEKAFDAAWSDAAFLENYDAEWEVLKRIFSSNYDLILPLAEAASKNKTLEQRVEAVGVFAKEKGLKIVKFAPEADDMDVASKNKGYIKQDEDGSKVLYLSEDLFTDEKGPELVREVMHEWAGHNIINRYGGRDNVPIMFLGTRRNREVFVRNRVGLTHVVDVIFSGLIKQFN